MKKGQIVLGRVDSVDFPNKGIVIVDELVKRSEDGTEIFEPIPEVKIIVKNTITGQRVRCLINKVRHGKAEARLLEVVAKSPIEIEPPCPHFAQCGGCTYQNLACEEQLRLKEEQVRRILTPVVDRDGLQDEWFEGIKSSPIHEEYRNKMEFTFGDEYKDGPLALGMHKRGSFYDIVSVSECRLVHQDYRQILTATLSFFKEKNIGYYHRIRHDGYLRHLLVRRGVKTGEILIDLVTSTQTANLGGSLDSNFAGIEEKSLLTEWVNVLLILKEEGKLAGNIAGILHTRNDSLADVVKDDGTDILYGQDFFFEELLGLKFKITPFSFFQTNSLGAQVLYETAREYAMEAISGIKSSSDSALESDSDFVSASVSASGRKPKIFDLYSGTGTIAQMMAPVAESVVGVEIVEEAVEAAKVNAEMNDLHNCRFLAGDVLKVIDSLTDPADKPDLIILDPPRDGCHPKALPKILKYGANHLVYISCKVTSLARDLEMIQAHGYRVDRAIAIDQFPNTGHVETVCLISRKP